MRLNRRFALRLQDILSRVREQRAAFLLDVFQDNIAVLDTAGTIIRVNRSWRDFARDNALSDADAAVGENYLAVCDRSAVAGDAVAAEAAAGIRAVMVGERSAFHMTYPCHACQERRWYNLYVSAVKGPGRARVIVRHADTTDLVLAAAEQERARAAAETAEDASAAKSRFLAMASHDLRQPMMALRLFLEVLNHRVGDPALRPVLDRANETLSALTDLFESLLDLSQLETGRRAVQAMPIPVAELMDRLSDEFGILAQQKGLSFRTAPCRQVVYGDPMLVERILRNFIANAIRYTEHGGLLVGCRRVGQRLRIDVIDTGVGIAPEQTSLIFQESYRVTGAAHGADHGSGTAHGADHGYGLGLAIVQRAANMMQVPVEVSSLPGKGSRFSILLPIVGGVEAHPRRSAVAKPRDDGDRRCLAVLVEDDPMVALAVRLFLEDFGCSVLAAADTGEALRLVDASPRCPDVIIANYRLGVGGNGIEAIARLRGLLRTEIPAWLITGDVSSELYRLARTHRVGYLRKPVRPEEIQACILSCRRDEGAARPAEPRQLR
ncbi:ATP-binding response regulator [Azospirillum sp. sgz302134]